MKRIQSCLSILLAAVLIFCAVPMTAGAKEVAEPALFEDVENASTVLYAADGTAATYAGVIKPDSLRSYRQVESLEAYEVYFDSTLLLRVELTDIDYMAPGSTAAGGEMHGYYAASFDFGEANHAFITGLNARNISIMQDAMIDQYDEEGDFSIEDLDFIDAEKIASSELDDNLCWAATTSNMLAYAGWNEPELTTDDIFERFIESFRDGGGYIEDGLAWYLNGVLPIEALDDEAALYDRNSGGYYTDYAYDELIGESRFTEDRIGAMEELIRRIEAGYAIGLSIGWVENNEREGGHAVTCWGYVTNDGYDASDPRHYEALLITDSDSDKEELYSDRREAPNCMRITQIRPYDNYAYANTHSYVLENYSQGVLEFFEWLAPYSDELATESGADAGTKDKSNTVDLKIDDVDLLCDENYYGYDSGNLFKQGCSITITPYIANYAEVDCTEEIRYLVDLKNEKGDTVYGVQAYPQDMMLSSFSSQYAFGDVTVYDLAIGRYTLDVEVNADRDIEEAYYYNNRYSVTFEVTADGPDLSTVHKTYWGEDIRSITFGQVRDLYAGLDHSIEIGLCAHVTFNDGNTYLYDFEYPYLYDHSKRYGGGNYQTYDNLAYYFYNNFTFMTDSDLSTTGVINVEVESTGVDVPYNDSLQMTVAKNPVKALEIDDTEDIVINPYIQNQYYYQYYDEEFDEWYGEYRYGYLDYAPYDMVIRYEDGSSARLSEIMAADLYYQTPFDGYSYSVYCGTPPYDGAEIAEHYRYQVEFISNQAETEWHTGKTYPVTVRYMGREVTYNVTIGKDMSDRYITSDDGLQFYIYDEDNAALIGIEDGVEMNVIEIPEEINGVAVRTIDSYAFHMKEYITEIRIPANVDYIGYGAFEDCVNLEHIEIAGTPSYVGEDAFHNTAWYNGLPDGCAYIGTVLYAYKNVEDCPASLEVLSGTTTIAEQALMGCDNLEEVILPETVRYINMYAFSCKNLKSIYIPNSVEEIDYCAIGYTGEWDPEIGEDIKVEGFVIYGRDNEVARKYAENNGFAYIDLGEIDPSDDICGDVDGDGAVTIVDATLIQKHLAGIPTKAFITDHADADEDDRVTITDATEIQRYLAGLGTKGKNIGKHIKKQFSLIFDPNGGTVDTGHADIALGSRFGELPVPKYDYHTFDGWYTAINGGDPVTEDSVFYGSSDLTLYAHWSENPILGWVIDTEVPDNASVVEEKWTYDLTDYKTSESKTMSGYTLYDTKENGWSSYGSWSSWSTTKATTSDSRQVETKTQYFYDRYKGTSNGLIATGPWKGSWSGIYCGTYEKKDWSDTKLTVWSTQTANGTTFNLYGKKGDSWYNQKTRTMYRYRDRTKKYIYYFKKVEQKESPVEITASKTISNVQHWVKYRIK